MHTEEINFKKIIEMNVLYETLLNELILGSILLMRKVKRLSITVK